MTDPAIQHISDTARWAAVYRARETERKKPLFRDPFARRLAGERGEQIAKATPFHEKHSWSWVTRTYLFDRIISEQVAHGADMVVNLAAGLDARPYRMQLPSQILRHKDVQVTRDHYIKTCNDQSVAAMAKLESAVIQAHFPTKFSQKPKLRSPRLWSLTTRWRKHMRLSLIF
jgi:hypothetical protein